MEEKKELVVKTKYEELYKTEYGYWIEHIEYEDEQETVRFESGGCSISNEVIDKLLDRAMEEGFRNCYKEVLAMDSFGERMDMSRKESFRRLKNLLEDKIRLKLATK